MYLILGISKERDRIFKIERLLRQKQYLDQWKINYLLQAYLLIIVTIEYNNYCLELVQMMLNQKMEGLKSNNYSFLKKLGSGASAVVYEGINERDGSTVAIKTIPRKLLQSLPKLEELVGTEIRVMRAISERKNQNVVRFIDRFMSEKSIFIVMEYCNGGDLQHQLIKAKVFNEQKATEYLKQILNGFRGMHEVKAMHRDFKLANLLLHQGVCKIADLGFAKQLGVGSLAITVCGTSPNMAPEVLEEKPYGIQADIWSLGVVFYQMMYGKYPYFDKKDISQFQMIKLIKNTKVDYSGVKISDKARDFIQRCLTIDPKMRISWREIYEHRLIKNENEMIYGLSVLQVNDMKNFYSKGVQVDEDYINMNRKKEKKKEQNISAMDILKVEKIDSTQIKKKLQRNDQKKLEDLAFKKYQEKYLKYRNNIMFIFKYVTPLINNLIMIVANHRITIFILAKKAYHDMIQLARFIEKCQNFLNLDPYFKQFTESSIYKQIYDRIKSDVEVIKIQAQSYWQGINQCNNDIKQQSDIDKVKNLHWQEFVQETARSYEFQLAGGLETLKQTVTKKDLLSVIEALYYYRNNFKKIDVEDFENKISNLDFKQSEEGVNSRLAEMWQQWND